jgi:transcription elongation factor GreA-like protein
MKKNLSAGENVCHRTRADWGIGKIAHVDTCGTIMVVFEGNRTLSFAKGINHLVKVDRDGKRIVS